MGLRKSFFDLEKCKLCGECLHQCPELMLTLDRAREEKAGINRGEISLLVSRTCTGCFNCDFYCPNQANPAETIVDHWWRKYQNQGLALRAKYFLPLERDNFRTYVMERLPADEKALLLSWNSETRCEEFIYPGCNVCAVPYITMTGLLPEIPIRGALDWCCGEMIYRMGLYDLFEQQGQRMRARFKELGAKNILMMCTAGTIIFSKVLPEKFGINFDIKFKPLLQYLWEEMESGRIKIERKLNFTATLQDSCYSKFMGKEYMELPRKILERIGIKVKEMPRSKSRAVCCGIGAGFSIDSAYNPVWLIRSTMRRIREAKKTGAEIICAYCAGCLQMLSVGGIFYPGAPDVYHILELIQMASGEKPKRRIKERARLILEGVLKNQAPELLSRKKFFPELK